MTRSERSESIGCGIDIGSRTTKLVLYDGAKKKVLAQLITDSKLDRDEVVRNLFRQAQLVARRNGARIKGVVATGYGRELVSFADKTITEITCHARGVCHLLAKTRTIIEIGGQDSKITRLDATGRVTDFAMNDRCAAGTGRFLEMVARLLEMDISRLGSAAVKSRRPANISSMCVVFAESEIIGLLAHKVSRQDIIAGIQKALATRVMAMVGRNLIKPIALTGGVALISGMAPALERDCGRKITVCPSAQFTGALGAAILATEI